MTYKLVILPVFLTFLTLATVASAISPSEVDVKVLINEDKTTEWTVSLLYNESVTSSDLYILARGITALEITVNGTYIDCQTIKRDVGTNIVCEEFRAFNEIVYTFRGHGIVSDFEDLQIFNQRFAITEFIDKITIMVKLPLGTALVEQSKISNTGLERFEPMWGKEGSDGRRIFVTWEQENPTLGEAINISVVYEQILNDQSIFFMIPLAVAAFIIIFYIYRKRFAGDILPILTDNERKVVEILMREKKDVDQRSIVKETDYSKSKVSRILQNLESRGLVERYRKGRTNMVKFKRS